MFKNLTELEFDDHEQISQKVFGYFFAKRNVFCRPKVRQKRKKEPRSPAVRVRLRSEIHVSALPDVVWPPRALRVRAARQRSCHPTAHRGWQLFPTCKWAATSGNISRQGCQASKTAFRLPCAHGPSRAASLMLPERSERADNKLDKHFARAARALTGRYIIYEAFCPNIQPRAHARFTGLTTVKANVDSTEYTTGAVNLLARTLNAFAFTCICKAMP